MVILTQQCSKEDECLLLRPLLTMDTRGRCLYEEILASGREARLSAGAGCLSCLKDFSSLSFPGIMYPSLQGPAQIF